MQITIRIDMKMMSKNDEELKGPKCRNNGGAYNREF